MKIKIYSTVSEFSAEEMVDVADAKDTDSILEVAMEILDSALVDYISDCFDEIPLSKKSMGFFPDPESIGEELRKQLTKCIESKLGNKLFIDVIDNSEITIATEAIDTAKTLNDEFEREQGYIYVGKIVLIMLKNFLINGVWQYGLRRGDGTILTDIHDWPKPESDGNSYTWHDSQGFLEPIIWFGIKNQSPIECWTIDKSPRNFELLKVNGIYNEDSVTEVERWNTFWFSSYGVLDWDRLFDNDGYCYIVWMFYECGMEEPEDEFYAVRDSCPIKLDGNDGSESMIRKIDEFFITTQLKR